MYNLDSVLYECTHTNTKTSKCLYDLNLKQDMEQLEKEYLGASKQNVSIVYTFQYNLYYLFDCDISFM